MTEVRATCQGCGTPLRAGARYCVQCGLEVRMPCPACEQEFRWLATIDPQASPWCQTRGTLVYACETCGRWQLPGRGTCEDPGCERRVLPTQPVHTGRRWDGRGSGAGWTCPADWADNSAPPGPVQQEDCAVPDALSAVCVAHGGVYVWAGPAWLRPAQGAMPGWRVPLGAASTPAPGLAFGDRIAVTGATAVLAEDRRFVAVSLCRPDKPERLDIGVPLAQAGGPDWWVGWTQEGERKTLRVAPVAPEAYMLAPETVEVPPAGELVPGGRLAIRGSAATWPARDGSVWQVDCAAREARQVLDASSGSLLVWAEADGPRTVREALGQLTLGLGAPNAGRPGREVSAGGGPLLGVFVVGTQVLAAGERICAFDMATGDRLSAPANLPAGRWISGAAAPAASGGVRLLGLTVGDGLARLYVLDVTAGTERVVWQAPDIAPLALLPAGRDLYVAHTRGVARLRRTSA